MSKRLEGWPQCGSMYSVGVALLRRTRDLRGFSTAARSHIVCLISRRGLAGKLHHGRRIIAYRSAAVILAALLLGYADIPGASAAPEAVRTATAANASAGDPKPAIKTGIIIFGIAGAIGSALLGAIVTYYFKDRPAERWKRTEYVRKAFQERYDSPGAKNASFLLYWPDRHIPLWDDDEENRWERVKDRETALAILPHVIHPFRFENPDFKQDKRRIALNDSFVDLIWRLDHVRVAADAAKPEDVHEVIHELGELLDCNANSTRLAPDGRLITSAFRLMLAWRDMRRLIQFFDTHGYDIRVTPKDIDLLKDAFPALNWDDPRIKGLETKVPRRAMHWRVQVLRQRDRTGAAVTTLSWMTTAARVIAKRRFGRVEPANRNV